MSPTTADGGPYAAAPFPAPAPAPAPYTNHHHQDPSPATSSFQNDGDDDVDDDAVDDEDEVTETEEESSAYYHHHYTPMPAPAPAPAPAPTPVVPPHVQPSMNHNSHQLYQQQPQPQPTVTTNAASSNDGVKTTTATTTITATSVNGDNDDKHPNLTAAAQLIHTLDTAYDEANMATATTALDAEQARITARTAAEIVRRYKTNSHPLHDSYFEKEYPPKEHYKSTPISISAGKAPMMTIQTNHNNHDTISSYTPRVAQFPKTPPSTASRIANANAQDALALSLELERTKQALEGERMAHDETKNLLAEERSNKIQLLAKLTRLESFMETQRENLGRKDDAMEEELKRTRYRMEAAEEDAQLALEFAKESQEQRERIESLLEQAAAEIQTLREQVANLSFYHASSSSSSSEQHANKVNGYHHQQHQKEQPPSSQQEHYDYFFSGDQPTMDQQQHDQQQPPEQPDQSEQSDIHDTQQDCRQEPEHNEHNEELLEPQFAQQSEHPQQQIFEVDQQSEQTGLDPHHYSHEVPEAALDTPKRTERSVHFSDPISFSKSPTEDSMDSDRALVEDFKELHEEPSFVSVNTPTRPSRPIVQAGRKLLHQSMGKVTSTSYMDDKTYSFEFTPEKSAERRQRLREQLKQLDSSIVIPTPPRSEPQQKQLQFTTNFYDLCKRVAEIIQSSGHRLELDGHWWREQVPDDMEGTPLDSLARQYCQSVEVKISRQKNEISELEALCSFLEESVAKSGVEPQSSKPYGADSGDDKGNNWTWHTYA